MVAHDGEDAISKQSGERFFDGTAGRAPDRLSQSSGRAILTPECQGWTQSRFGPRGQNIWPYPGRCSPLR